MSATYYQPSGKISVFGVVGGLVVGGGVALVTAFLYAAALVYIPVAQIAFILPFGFGALSGAVTVEIARRFKLRNRLVAVGLALVTTSIAYFVSWIPWSYFTLSHADVDIGFFDLLNPLVLSSLLAEIYEVGAWSLGSSSTPVSGALLGVCWFSEMVIVLGMAAGVGYTLGAKGVFCEGCEGWCLEVPNLVRYTSAAEPELRRRLGLRDLAALEQLPRAGLSESPWLELKLCHCEGCGQTNTLFVERCTESRDHRGNRVVARAPLIPHLLVRRDEVQWLRGVASR